MLQVYRKAARIDDHSYHAMLDANAGTDTSTSSAWTDESYDAVMASIEAYLFDRVDRDIVPNPIPGSTYIRSRTYWRAKNPGGGLINSRQVDRINRLWADLMPHINEDNRNTEYFCGIIAKATAKPSPRRDPLTHAEAGYVIDALTDRLKHAIRRTA
jgi:hypothetical protein